MVFSDGKEKSIEGIILVFELFAAMSGLRISLEKSTIFLAGISNAQRTSIINRFSLENGNLPVRYLGLPLIAKKMTKADYAPLVEKIKTCIRSWKICHISFAGRLQLLASVISGILNFWMAAFQLPNSCIKEVESLCSAFLWSGPILNPRKAKVSWEDVCKPKVEGGLGLRSLREVNMVCSLKLVWRFLFNMPSLWASWLRCRYVKGNSFWSLPESPPHSSWIWWRMLKIRIVAQRFYYMEVNNGERTSFWLDRWSSLGRIFDITGSQGFIRLGIPSHYSLDLVWRRRRRKCHRCDRLTDIERAIETAKGSRRPRADQSLWQGMNDIFGPNVSTKATWNNIRTALTRKAWSYLVWFQNATPKYAFITWLAMRKRLSTGECMTA
ncbi:uncharacterized protein LOC112089134 [Eutrema salsugineum]|uniref:uncharacterized protein LOC112089134 n=1 Tax=Eutrema salsugineum TaxID=72664 RepID=UPI000CED0265|nr:uncharacterized protein LOC112089134 [Eutrema salsugineum]